MPWNGLVSRARRNATPRICANASVSSDQQNSNQPTHAAIASTSTMTVSGIGRLSASRIASTVGTLVGNGHPPSCHSRYGTPAISTASAAIEMTVEAIR